MGTFDSHADAPKHLQEEAQDITLHFERTGPNTGRVSWNIPNPAQGCDSDTQAYDGIVLTLDTEPASREKAPTDENYYISDPVANKNLHAGDQIGTALVIGAVYSDKSTNFIDISGLQPNTPYYVSGYPVDAQARYYTAGVHAYSQNLKSGKETDATSATHTIELVKGTRGIGVSTGVEPSDATGLDASTSYSFEIKVDDYDRQTININGANATTYDALTTAINRKLKLLENPQQSPTPPDKGKYYWNVDTQQLFKWDGEKHVEQEVLVEPTQPNDVSAGDYWLDPDDSTLYRWGGSAWNQMPYINLDTNPSTFNEKQYWFDGTNAYYWSGSAWCKLDLYNQTNDPSQPVYPDYGTYWFNENDSVLYRWDGETLSWKETTALLWDTDPNNLADQTYWFDETNQLLKQYDSANDAWTELDAKIQTEEPEYPEDGQYWYNPDTETLKQYNDSTDTWDELDVLIWPSDPTDRETCGLWWDSSDDKLYQWDVTTSQWNQITPFIISSKDPAEPPELTDESAWYHPDTEQLRVWDCTRWVQYDHISFPSDPRVRTTNDVWYNTSDQTWSYWDGATWVQFNPIDSSTDPTSPATGSFWYNTTDDSLNQWDGSGWVNVSYTTIPLTPAVGEQWYDLQNRVLKVWNGSSWVITDPVATAEITANGNMIFTASSTGSLSMLTVTNNDLFDSLDLLSYRFLEPNFGEDGISSVPTYREVGVGDDGTTDERRYMAEEIRAHLGYPTVEVELTKQQIDFAINRALEQLRRRSSAGYKRTFFFMDMEYGKQHYKLTNRQIGFHRIVNVEKMHRITSAFLSTLNGTGAYGQMVLQHLYSMGTYDLLSYHLISDYVEQLEQLFATRMTFLWDEQSRTLQIMTAIHHEKERVLVDCTVERTEQDLMTDRWVRHWIFRYALAQSRYMLAEVRGKYATLPGAGGGVALNAGELQARADAEFETCEQELADFIVDNIEDFGIEGHLIIG